MSQFITAEFQGFRGEQQQIWDEQRQMTMDMNESFAFLRGEIENWKRQYPPPPSPEV